MLPFLLGYQPEESLVMAAIRDRVIEVCVRVDLTEDPEPVAERFAEIARANEASGVLLVAYGADADRADRLLLPVIEELAPIGVIDAIYTDGERRWSRVCADAGCCPPEGVRYDPAGNRLAAEAVFSGMTHHRGRDEVARLVQGPAADDVQRLSELAETMLAEVYATDLGARRGSIRDWVGDHVRRRMAGESPMPSDAEAVWLACLILDLTVRDEAWALMTRENAWAHVELWQRVVSRAVPPLVVPALGLLGMAAWISGQGTLQTCCIERARAVNPAYTLIDVLEDINARALSPDFWESVRDGMVAALAEMDDTDRPGQCAGRIAG